VKCSRCEIQFTAASAMVKDHRYVQECIDALKARVRELEREPGVQPMPAGPPSPGCLPTCSCMNGCEPNCPNIYRISTSAAPNPIPAVSAIRSDWFIEHRYFP